jgi:predicted nucleotidyltransferase
MKVTPQTIPDLNQIGELVRPLCKRYSVARMQLFGSVASGKAGAKSDLDFLVEFLPDAHAGLLEMGGLKEDLELKFGRSVDLVSRAAVERSRNLYRRRSILAAPVTVYAQ